MKKSIALSFALLLLTLVAQAQSTETRNLEAFSRLSVAEGIKAIVVKGNTEAIDISVSGNITAKEVLAEIKGDRLRVHLEDGRRYRRVDVKVKITCRSLTAISASSAARIDLQSNFKNIAKVSASSAGSVKTNYTISGSSMALNVSSAGRFEGKVQANDLKLNASSAGKMLLSGGSTNTLVARGSSSGRIKAQDFTSQSAEIRVSSGGSIRVNVSQTIEARASSGGSIIYAGNPQKVNVKSSSGGSIRKR
ncbi:head GIN domain-containing protein [Microscilla marina]|uniref:Putative auto-transporter adhesin head GIN domain-containing protein n=1 Tax=Microscilla marina ATCC 23134 TaxID=313606 RepID=A1ZRI9_MICM2|nr:head GIN domain-containing protein [Microscilla marina]EAY27079.1 conserved hypothetical protein [Microscilla marina ATCC 23134]